MINVLFIKGGGQHYAAVRRVISETARAFEVDLSAPLAASGLPEVDLVVLDLEHMTDEVRFVRDDVRLAFGDVPVMAVGPETVAERARLDRTLDVEFWVIVPAGEVALRTQTESVLAAVAHRSQALAAPTSQHLAPRRPEVVSMEPERSHAPSENTLSRAVGRMMAAVSLDKLFDSCCDAVQELSGCTNYCLFWIDPTRRFFHIVRAHGLAPAIESACRLSHQGPLVSCMYRTRGLTTLDLLIGGHHQEDAARELEMCGGVLAAPIFSQGALQGFIILGPKAIGSPYSIAEMEALVMLATSFASVVRQSELRGELQAQKGYIDQVLKSMASGIVTLDAEGRIRVCNAHAGQVLGLDPPGLIGEDIRALPAPLGDHLYACLRYGEELDRLHVSVLGGTKNLRVSTRRLFDQSETLLGSMMLVEDISAEMALAAEKRKAERNEVISQIVARFAHELKNPLATIQTFTELLPARYDDPEFKDFWSEHVMRDVHRLDDLVTKLVSLSEPPHTTREVVRVPDLVREAVERVSLLDDEAVAKIESVPNGELPSVRVNISTMAAAIAHLLRYGMGLGHKTVTIKAEMQDGPEGEQPVAIYIRATTETDDTADPRQVLEPSYVIDHPDVDLGPSASQRLIESQGGALDAYRDDDGIVFRISLIPVANGSSMKGN